MTVALAQMTLASNQTLTANTDTQVTLDHASATNTDTSVFDTGTDGQITVLVACKARVSWGVGFDAGNGVADRSAWFTVNTPAVTFYDDAQPVTPQWSGSMVVSFAANDVVQLWAFSKATGSHALVASSRGPETFLSITRLDAASGSPTIAPPRRRSNIALMRAATW